MPSFSELLRQILQAPEAYVSSQIPGDWEALEQGVYQPPSGDFWSHNVDEGFPDCVLGVEFDNDHLMHIVIAQPKFEWQVHQLRVIKGREVQRIPFRAPSESTIQEVHAAVLDGIFKTRRSWKKCRHCRDRQPIAYMQERGICMGCAPGVLGTVY